MPRVWPVDARRTTFGPGVGRFREGTMHHGTESFFIEGEGLVDTSLGGRGGTQPDRVDDPGAPAPRLEADEAPPFRFSRLGPRGVQLSEKNLQKIATAMIQEGRFSTNVPAAFTYLGQFVDHDLPGDRTQVELGEHVNAAELVQSRSPRLDLDSLYGAGPLDEVSAAFYAADGLHLKVGRTLEASPGEGFDLPRIGTGTAKQKRTANIPDLRNDENLAVAQTHCAFIR